MGMYRHDALPTPGSVTRVRTPAASAIPARTRSASRVTAPTRARASLTPPDPGSRPATPPGRYASAQLDPTDAAPAEARKLTREFLARRDMRALTADAELIGSELITNALACVPRDSTGLAIIYAIHAAPGELRISVWDIGPGHPQPAHPDPDPDPDDETGRGLTIIDALTAGHWGWKPTPKSGGKVTWAVLAAGSSQERPAGATENTEPAALTAGAYIA
jgi:serine/threonine-protein kinase RsbW